MSGIGKNRQRSIEALGALTFGHVAKLPSMLLKQKFGIWGQQLWLFSNGQWNEPLVLEIKDRTTISSSTTLPQDEHDYEAALTFMLSESTRLTGQLRREKMQAREFSVAVRFTNFTEVGTSHRFKHPQFLNSVINEVMEQMFRGIMAGQRFRCGRFGLRCSTLKSWTRIRHFGGGRMKNAGARWMTWRKS